MTAVAAAPDVESHGYADDGDHSHPPDAFYWKVGAVLAVLTGIEVTTYWWKDWFGLSAETAGRVTGPVLIILMVIKFVSIAAFFMHLRYDNKLLRRVFVAGLILSLFVYLAGLSAMNWWVASGTELYNDAPRTRPTPPPPTEKPSIPAVTTGH